MSVQIICISGQGRSGSTLLTQVLGQHSDITSVGELFPFSERFIDSVATCACGKNVQQCPFWSDVLKYPEMEEAIGKLGQIEFHKLMRLRNFLFFVKKLQHGDIPPPLKLGAEAISLVVNRIQKASPCSTIVDASKKPNAALLYYLAGFQVHILHLVRDSRGIVYSWRGRSGEENFTGGRNVSLRINRLQICRSSLEYYFYNLFAESAGKLMNSCQQVNYEDFTQSPATNLSRIFTAFGLTDESSQIVFDNTFCMEESLHIMSGNSARFNHGQVKIEKDQEWQSCMNRIDRAITTVITYPVLKRHGYL